MWFGTWRVNGQLGVARSIGDADHMGNFGSDLYFSFTFLVTLALGAVIGVVVAQPDSIERDISADDSFVMLASDGLFDVFKHEEAAQVVRHLDTFLPSCCCVARLILTIAFVCSVR